MVPYRDDMKTIVVTAPSGAGKTTIVKSLLNKLDKFEFSVSATTRQMREGEVDGKDYYFLTPWEFHQRAEAGDFVEWEEVYEGLFYGTLKSEVKRLTELGKYIIFDIDVKGALNLKRYFGDKCLALFIKPPSYEILAERLKNRNTESENSLKKRLDKVKIELDYEQYFDYTIVNDKLEVAISEATNLTNAFINRQNAEYELSEYN